MRGYLTKDARADEIARAITAAHEGHVHFDPAVQRRLADVVARPDPAGPATSDRSRLASDRRPADGLTPRQGEVLRLVAAGHSNREIAGALFITEATVKTHINNLLAKARVRDRAQAVAYAFRHGLATPERNAP